jgi:hypothetical protein
MSRRVLIAGVVAGIVLFVWGMLSHTVLGLGEVGVKPLPNQAAVLDNLKQNITEPGLYLFPYEVDPAKWQESYRSNPHGILVATPAGDEFSFPRNLALELVTNLVCGLLLAWIAARFTGGASWQGGALLGLALGLFAHVDIIVSFVFWYDFPMDYAVAQLADHAIAGILAGAVGGAILGRR